MTGLGDQYVFLWVGFSLMCVLGLSVVFVWAWRAGQFRDQDRARWLALWAEVPGEGADARKDDRGPDGGDASAAVGPGERPD